MSIRQDPQVPLPGPPTGVALVITEHGYNPETGHYEPPLRTRPENASIDSGTLAAPTNLIIFAAGDRPVWIYHIVLANTGNTVQTCEITEPGGNVYTVELPANTLDHPTAIITSTPDAPLFVARPAAAVVSNLQFGSTTLGQVTATITYVAK